jgi:hypothetical protein
MECMQRYACSIFIVWVLACLPQQVNKLKLTPNRKHIAAAGT